MNLLPQIIGAADFSEKLAVPFILLGLTQLTMLTSQNAGPCEIFTADGLPVQLHGLAERLVLSPKTVRNHVSNIFSKLQVADGAQAIIQAREAGMGKQE